MKKFENGAKVIVVETGERGVVTLGVTVGSTTFYRLNTGKIYAEDALALADTPKKDKEKLGTIDDLLNALSDDSDDFPEDSPEDEPVKDDDSAESDDDHAFVTEDADGAYAIYHGFVIFAPAFVFGTPKNSTKNLKQFLEDIG